MKIDLTIGWDDLSKECKEQIKNLKTLGYDVQLHYPTIAKNGLEWMHYNPEISITSNDFRDQLITTCKTSNTAGNSSGGI